MPEQLDTKILPLLPLTTGVVLPGMVVTVTLETAEARTAVTAARSAENEILLVPRLDDRYAHIGTAPGHDRLRRGRDQRRHLGPGDPAA
jgi:ATP-dependent Lon protease